ncbi:SKP1-like protein 1B [Rhynchospora pubera]|uniref:SKP1-like protein n=1 Tax=Rhynchospora pubera TaxID=906938 RepID=A0AAV8C9A0_9POAL|nr:SKP1-like protein 1B [Rhynchospora pubera]
MARSSTENMITLMSSDGEEFMVTEKVARECTTIRNMLEDDCVITNIPLPNVTSDILSMVIEYCKEHVATAEKAAAETAEKGSSSAPAAAKANKDLEEWDKAFMNVDVYTLCDLILAANYLNVSGLLDLAIQTAANLIKGKSPEQIRKTFHIQNDLSLEEEEKIRSQTPWAFEESE